MSFGQFLVDMTIILGFFAVISIWVFAMVDIFRRRDMSGWWKAVWLVVIIVLPVLGTCIYLIARPGTATYYGEPAMAPVPPASAPASGGAQPRSTADELTSLSALVDKGMLTPEEFQAEKARILGTAPAPSGANANLKTGV